MFRLSLGSKSLRWRAGLAAGGLAALMGLSALTPLASQAQTGATVITIAIPAQQKELYTGTIIPAFEKDNPSITVQALTQSAPNIPSAATNVGNFLDGLQAFVSQSDVVLISDNNVTAEATRAGYYLNLQPLIDSDTSLNQADFYPNAFRAFQWDQGTWALPISVDATILSYDPAAFDKAGINYPTAQWTLDDLIAAVKKLTITDQSGAIVTPGIELFRGNNDIPLFMSLLGKPLYDPNSIPNPPAINQPEVQSLLDNLTNLFAIVPQQSATFGTAPIQIGSIRQLAFRGAGGNANAPQRKGVLLPGGHAYLTTSGVAVSSATQHPEAAYAFAKFLTTRTDVGGFGASYPARQSLLGQNSSGAAGGGGAGGFGGGGAGFFSRLTADVKQLYTDSITNGYSATDRRFYDYLGAAITDMRTNNVDSKTAIADAQTNALQAQQTALTRKADASKVAVVATPLPTLAPNAGITLKFGMSAFGRIPNQAAIQSLADQFVQQNPGVVGRIDLEVLANGPNGVTDATTNYDCFYLPYSDVSNVALNTVLSLDPYLTADANYNASDFVGGVLSQVTRDNKIWALPMNIQPTVMWYDPLALGNAGVPKPQSGWDISAFNAALKALQPSLQKGNPPFTAQADTGSTLLMLVAAYGGLPIDFRTSPVTINFTDKTNVDAMQQVLDLAKSGLIDYRSLANTLGFFVNGNVNNPLYSQELNGLNFRGQRAAGSTNPQSSNYAPVTFPKGSAYQMMSYSVGTLYISASAQNPDACYRWISLFAQHPELTNAMPARNSLLSNAQLDTQFGAALAQAYRDAGKVLNDPNTIGAPSLVGGFANLTNTAVQHWLFEAWDNYVLNGKDLASGLADAQNYASGFLQCYATIPPFDPAQEKYTDYLTQVVKCVTKTDPRLSASLRGLGG